tara:strand:- start:925 stop:1059 length:135 start_codon:yes stop_codon:yes gene_type:complete
MAKQSLHLQVIGQYQQVFITSVLWPLVLVVLDTVPTQVAVAAAV